MGSLCSKIPTCGEVKCSVKSKCCTTKTEDNHSNHDNNISRYNVENSQFPTVGKINNFSALNKNIMYDIEKKSNVATKEISKKI